MCFSRIEDAVRAVPEERMYVGLLGLFAGGYITYLSPYVEFGGLFFFGLIVMYAGLWMFTPHSHQLDAFIEPVMGAAGATMVLPYLQTIAETGVQRPEPVEASMVAFGVLLLATSITSLVYGDDTA